MDYLGRLLGRIYGERPAIQPDVPPLFGAQEPFTETIDPLADVLTPPPTQLRTESPLLPAPPLPHPTETPAAPPPTVISSRVDAPAPPSQPRTAEPTDSPTPPAPLRADSVLPAPNDMDLQPVRETHIERLTERVLRVETEYELFDRETIRDVRTPEITSPHTVRTDVGPPEEPPARPLILPDLPPVMPPSAPRPVSDRREEPPIPQKVINVRIGRIEVRSGASSAPAPKSSGGRKKSQAISLEDYLRNGGKP